MPLFSVLQQLSPTVQGTYSAVPCHACLLTRFDVPGAIADGLARAPHTTAPTLKAAPNLQKAGGLPSLFVFVLLFFPGVSFLQSSNCCGLSKSLKGI